MEGPGLESRKTTTPAPTPRIRHSGCSRPAAILLYPHTCLRRLAKFEGVSVWRLFRPAAALDRAGGRDIDSMPRCTEGETPVGGGGWSRIRALWPKKALWP